MLLFRGHLYRVVRASKASLATEIQAIMDQHAQRYNDALKHLTSEQFKGIPYVQKLSYQSSKALAKDLNEVVHLEHELYANLFGVQYINDFENEDLCTLTVETVFREYGGQLRYCAPAGKKLWMRGHCTVGWSYTAEELADEIEELIQQEETKDPAAQFLTTLVQHGSDLGFRAVPTFAPAKTVKIEIGGSYAELSRVDAETVQLDYFVAYGIKGGWGSRVLAIITDLADRFCVQVNLIASPMAKFEYVPEFQPRPKGQQMNLKQLMEFYQRFGFDPVNVNKWGANMERDPNCRVN